MFFLVLSLSMITTHAYSQTENATSFNYTGTEFKEYLNKLIEKHQSIGTYLSIHVSQNNKEFYSVCHQGVAFVRFKLDETGKIKDIGCSQTTPIQIAKALKEAIMASEKYWIVIPNSRDENTWLIQPVIYDLGINCDKKVNDVFTAKGSFFQFDDGSIVTDMVCLIFEPWITKSGVDEKTLVPTPKN